MGGFYSLTINLHNSYKFMYHINKVMNLNPSIPLHLIESFLAVVKNGTLQEAATELQITQPALSKQMFQLEGLLPFKLFVHVGRKKVLTHYGQSLYDVLAPRFLHTQELIQQTSLLFTKPDDVKVKVCGRGELLDLLMTNLEFSGQVTFSQMNNAEAIDSVLKRKSDIGIVHSSIDTSELVLKPLLTNSFVLAIPKSFFKGKKIDEREIPRTLKISPCVLYKTDDPVLNSLREWGLAVSDLKTSRVYSNYSSLAKMVDLGKAWAMLPTHIEVSKTRNFITPIKRESSTHRKFYLCYRPELKSAVWFKDFLGGLRAFLD